MYLLQSALSIKTTHFKTNSITRKTLAKIDIFTLNGHIYLVAIDYFSHYIEIVHFNPLTSDSIINKMKNIFSQMGDSRGSSNNGSQFTSTGLC